jgi:hypothetical protein
MEMYSNNASGSFILLTASVTFPVPFKIQAFGDENDPFDMDSVQIQEVVKDLNGNVYDYGIQNFFPVTINVSQNTPEQLNLALLAKRNLVGTNQARDIITLQQIVAGEVKTTYFKGKITEAPFGSPAGSNGKLKNMQYKFKFGNVS